MTRQLGIVLFDGAEELDFIGPWEVLSFWCRAFPDDGWAVHLVAQDDRPLTCAKGMTIVPELSATTAPRFDAVLFPGGIGTRTIIHDDSFMAWAGQLTDRARLLTSVCTGAFVLAKLGLLAGQPATTHWRAFDELAAIDPTIVPREDDRFVDTGRVVTAAGVSAGIDMALHLVARLGSVAHAVDVRRGIQYDPQPPV